MAGDSGTCGFCGTGDGYLGDQGDESTQYLHSAVLTINEKGERSYERHPNAMPDKLGSDAPGQSIVWCGGCIGGLKHKFQRLSDHNLYAEITALKVWTELDAPHWSLWNADDDEARAVLKKHVQDDPAIHLDKLHRETRLRNLEDERFRRAGFDLTSRGWRP